MMRIFRLTVLAAACLLLFASVASAFGDIAYPDRPLNLRRSRSAQSEWVGVLHPGQKVRIAGEKDGWVAVYEPDETDSSKVAGYSNSRYLLSKRTRHEPKEWGQLVYTTNKLNVRSQPSIKGRKVGVLQPMDHVIIDFPEDQWTMVFKPDATIRSRMNGIGFCSAHYFKPATAQSKAKAGLTGAAPAADVAAAPAKQDEEPKEMGYSETKRLTVKSAVNLRQSRTEESPLIRQLAPGEEVQVGLLRDGWYAVFAASDFIRSESSSLGYARQPLLDDRAEVVTMPGETAPEEVAPAEEAAEAAAAEPEADKPEAEAPKKAAAPAVSMEAIKAEAVKAPEPEPKAEPKPVKREVAAAPKSEPVIPEPAKAKPESVRPEPSQEKPAAKQQTMVIDRSAFVPTKRPDPTPDQTAHGYRFRFIEKSETRQFGEPWITLKVFLATDKLPDREALADFATTLWRDHKRVTKKVAVLVYLPGMDLDDLAWGVVKFDNDEMLELWVRRAALFGTQFM